MKNVKKKGRHLLTSVDILIVEIARREDEIWGAFSHGVGWKLLIFHLFIRLSLLWGCLQTESGRYCSLPVFLTFFIILQFPGFPFMSITDLASEKMSVIHSGFTFFISVTIYQEGQSAPEAWNIFTIHYILTYILFYSFIFSVFISIV